MNIPLKALEPSTVPWPISLFARKIPKNDMKISGAELTADMIVAPAMSELIWDFLMMSSIAGVK
jgi:hypothetical protein